MHYNPKVTIPYNRNWVTDKFYLLNYNTYTHEKTTFIRHPRLLHIYRSGSDLKEWQDAEINAINRAPMHANFFAYENARALLPRPLKKNLPIT